MNKYTEEIKNKYNNFKSEPGRLFGLVYPYILTLIIIIGFVYVLEMNNISRQMINPSTPDSTVQSELQIVQARTIPPVDVNEISKTTELLVGKGKTLYSANCSSCHGEQGKGNGAAATGLNPPPRDFTLASGWKNGTKLNQIYQTLQEGIPGSAMIAYDFLTPEEKFSLAHYIRSSFIKNPANDTPDDLATMDQLYNLSKGMEIPAQIPVIKAANLIMKENELRVQEVSRIMGSISQSNDQNSELFNRVVNNKFRALAALSSDKSWKNSESSFIRYISLNANQNGFNSTVFSLSGEEWSRLYKYFNGMF